MSGGDFSILLHHDLNKVETTHFFKMDSIPQFPKDSSTFLINKVRGQIQIEPLYNVSAAEHSMLHNYIKTAVNTCERSDIVRYVVDSEQETGPKTLEVNSLSSELLFNDFYDKPQTTKSRCVLGMEGWCIAKESTIGIFSIFPDPNFNDIAEYMYRSNKSSRAWTLDRGKNGERYDLSFSFAGRDWGKDLEEIGKGNYKLLRKAEKMNKYSAASMITKDNDEDQIWGYETQLDFTNTNVFGGDLGVHFFVPTYGKLHEQFAALCTRNRKTKDESKIIASMSYESFVQAVGTTQDLNRDNCEGNGLLKQRKFFRDINDETKAAWRNSDMQRSEIVADLNSIGEHLEKMKKWALGEAKESEKPVPAPRSSRQ